MSISYDDHREFLKRQSAGAHAELYGFIQARLGQPVQYSTEPELERRFQMGYADGRAKMIEEGQP